MENQPQPQFITPLSLLNRQLSDWQQLLANLSAADPATTADQLVYCQRQIERIETEIRTFSN